MKKYILIGFFLFLNIYVKAQNTAYDKMNDTLISLYNNKQFKAIYPLLSTDFKTQMSENQLLIFFKNNLFSKNGKVINHSRLNVEEDGVAYKWDCEKGKLKMTLAIGKDNIINGFLFEPIQEETKKAAVLSNNPLKTDLEKKIDTLVRQYIDKVTTVGLSVGILKDGKTHTFHYGVMDKITAKQPDDNTFYEIGSITKTFTGTLLAQAVIEKKIKLDDDIRLYLPEKYPNLEYKGQPILVKHLANHTSRIPSFPFKDITTQKGYDAKNPYKHYTSDMVLAYLHQIELDTTPGYKSDYSNFATGLMGIILEKIYKMPYADLVKKYIATPLSMNDTKVYITDSTRFAKPHNRQGQADYYWDFTGLSGAGAIRSTVKDMLQYAQTHMTAKEDYIKLTQTATFQDKSTNAVGLYWQLSTNSNGQLITWHNGMTGGFSSFCGFSKEYNVAVVLLSNSSDNVTQKGFELMKMLVDK
jgi:CubicO group peptidase (beta-lactamase class C family)